MIKRSDCRTLLPTNCKHFGGRVHTKEIKRKTQPVKQTQHVNTGKGWPSPPMFWCCTCDYANMQTKLHKLQTVALKFSTLVQQNDGPVAFTWPVHTFCKW